MENDNFLNRLNKIAEDREAEKKALPVCPDCLEHHKETPCEICIDIQYQKSIQRRKDIIRLDGLKAFEDFTGEKFKNKALYSAVCEHYPKNVFIHGPVGRGKSHLATAVFRYPNYKNGRSINALTLCDKVNSLHTTAEKVRMKNYYINIPYLLIDDIAVKKMTTADYNIIYDILQKRLMAKRNGLILTSNYSIKELSIIMQDDRITSRICGMCRMFEIQDVDWRKKPKKKEIT